VKSNLSTFSKIKLFTLVFFNAIAVLIPSHAFPCSTFMLSREGCLIVGHNLDQSFYTPAIIHINPGGEWIRSISSFDLGLGDVKTPALEWVSKYGSATFSYLGRNLPDCGINEVGLTVSEMALAESAFPFSDSLPTMIVHQWIQYQLDNFAMVEEVLEHLGKINIEPVSTFTPPASANYHFFITDARGGVAIIEFLGGQPGVYFRTARHPGMHYFDLGSFDFSPGAPSLVFENMDTELHGGRNISNRFVPFTTDSDRRVVDWFLRNLIQFVAKTDDPDRMDRYLRDNYGIGVDQYIKRALKMSALIRLD